jgi:cobalt-zinc-cadmium efflux system protein
MMMTGETMHNHNNPAPDTLNPEKSPGNSSGDYGDCTASLRTGIIVTLIIFVIEIAGGVYSGSLSLISDAGHMFIDAAALLLSLTAIRAARSLPKRNGPTDFTAPGSLQHSATASS